MSRPSLPPAMRHYDARRLPVELLAVILALEHFKPYIDGVKVLLDSDHRNLTFIKNIKHSSGQLARWAMRLSEYDFELRYRPGKQMEVADCLSRNPLDRELTEAELEPVMYCCGVSQMELATDDHGALFQVTYGSLPQTREHFMDRKMAIDRAAAKAAVSSPDSECARMFSDVTAVALATVDETAGGDSDEEAEAANDPEVDQEEENLLAVQRINMQRRTPITEDDFRGAYPADDIYKRVKLDWNHDTKGPNNKKKWSFVDDMLFRRQGGQTLKYVPESLRTRLLNVIHDSDYNMHAGRDQTLQDLKARYYWSGMDHDVSEYLKRCIWCRKAKTVVPTRAGFLQQTLHQHDGALMSIDLVGPLRLAKGKFNYILTVLDAFSHKLIAVPINSKSATSVLDAFQDHVVLQGLLPSRLVSAFSTEEPVQNLVQDRRGRGRKVVHRKGRVVSDNGKEFKNQLFRTFLKQFEIKFGYSIPYHPQSNPVERVHRYMNDLLRIAIDRSDSVYDHWTEALPYIVFSYNKRYINGTKISPFMLRNGFQPRYPEDLPRDEFRCADKTFQQRLDDRIDRYQACEKAVYEANEIMKAKNKVQYDAHQYSQEYKVGDKVLHHCSSGLDKLHLRWHGPFEIVEKISPVSSPSSSPRATPETISKHPQLTHQHPLSEALAKLHSV